MCFISRNPILSSRLIIIIILVHCYASVLRGTRFSVLVSRTRYNGHVFHLRKRNYVTNLAISWAECSLSYKWIPLHRPPNKRCPLKLLRRLQLFKQFLRGPVQSFACKRCMFINWGLFHINVDKQMTRFGKYSPSFDFCTLSMLLVSTCIRMQ